VNAESQTILRYSHHLIRSRFLPTKC